MVQKSVEQNNTFSVLYLTHPATVDVEKLCILLIRPGTFGPTSPHPVFRFQAASKALCSP